ncbi:MAG: formate dehydrogenase accessory sulfurtransferase FdhD [Steroidobacteraceae bacterium]
MSVAVQRWGRDGTRSGRDMIASELPVALEFNGVAYAVMMVTPVDLEDFAVGFCMTEGLVEHPADIRSIEIETQALSARLRLTINARQFAALLRRRRAMAGFSSCGICGVESLDDALRKVPRAGSTLRVSAAQVQQWLADLAAWQPVNAVTGGMHAAAWIHDGRLRQVREDIGRHNALDKVLGAVMRKEAADCATGLLLVTSRASYEMVLKAAQCRIEILIAMSAPTSLAVQSAENCGMTLVAFARPGQHVVYTHAERIGG